MPAKKTALITGVTGQDGAYLAKNLLERDYTVYGLMQRSTRYAFENLDYLGVTGDVDYIDGDLTDEASLIRAVRLSNPDEVSASSSGLATTRLLGVSFCTCNS